MVEYKLDTNTPSSVLQKRCPSSEEHFGSSLMILMALGGAIVALELLMPLGTTGRHFPLAELGGCGFA